MVSDVLRTIVYIDGFNFYYGELRGTPWKWLDMQQFFQCVLGNRNDVLKLKYFTAKVQPTLSDPQVNLRQDTYFRALNTYCEKVEIHLGHFLRHEVLMEHANPPPSRVRVMKNEEKGSDVNLAIHLLNDAWLDLFDCAVIVSNDSDLAEALRLVKSQHNKVVGLITPGAPKRKSSRQLLVHADFVKPIRTHYLRQSLLPEIIPGTNIHNPSGW